MNGQAKTQVEGPMTRRQFGQSALAVFPAVRLCSAPAVVPKRRPNVLILLSDQESQLAAHESLALPNRARLEKSGLKLTKAFCTTPQCSPSRASLLTGLYPHSAQVVSNVDLTSLGKPLSPDIPSLGKVFRDRGYQTAYLGKWHLGDTRNGLGAFGFSSFEALPDADLVKAAAGWIGERDAQPWLLVVSFENPHDIYYFPVMDEVLRARSNLPDSVRARRLPERLPKVRVRPGVKLPMSLDDDLKSKPKPQLEYLTKDQGKYSLGWEDEDWRRYRGYYLDLIEKLDSEIGLILDALEKHGQAEDTITVYASDHGDMMGAHRLPFKGPFMYDEQLNVPLVVSFPGAFRASGPVSSNSLASLIDVVPTLCDLAGFEWPWPLSGKSLTRLFEHPMAEVRSELFSEYYAKQHWENPIRTIRTASWKYNRYVSGPEELYDLQNDPFERRNVAYEPGYRRVLENLRARLEKWRRESHDPLLRG